MRLCCLSRCKRAEPSRRPRTVRWGLVFRVCRLRALNVTQLRELDKTLVIQDNDKPLAVLSKYEHFLAIEKILKAEVE